MSDQAGLPESPLTGPTPSVPPPAVVPPAPAPVVPEPSATTMPPTPLVAPAPTPTVSFSQNVVVERQLTGPGILVRVIWFLFIG